MSVSRFIAHRYLTGKKKMFAAFLSAVAVLSVSLGVFALIVVMSVMRGFTKDLEQKLMGFGAHVVVEDVDDFAPVLDNVKDDISSHAVIVEGEGIISNSQEDISQGAKVRGVDPESLINLKGINWYLNPDDLTGENWAIIGSELAFQMGIDPELSNLITITVPFGSVSPSGEIIPRQVQLVVKGIFQSGYFEYDSKMVLISRLAAEDVFSTVSRPQLQLWLKNSAEAFNIKDAIKNSFSSANVRTWSEGNKKLFSALRLERFAMTLLLLLIVAIACMSVISVIFMYVFARRKDIAILEAIGAPRAQIRNIFIQVGACIGFIGASLGIAGGVFVCLYLGHKQVGLPSSYYLDRLPVDLSWSFVLAVGISSLILAIIASLYPACKGAGGRIHTILRYE